MLPKLHVVAGNWMMISLQIVSVYVDLKCVHVHDYCSRSRNSFCRAVEQIEMSKTVASYRIVSQLFLAGCEMPTYSFDKEARLAR